MSDIRRAHRGYFNVTLGLAVPWYCGLGVGFLVGQDTLAADSQTYDLIEAYVPLTVWGASYLCVGAALLTAILVGRVPHGVVRVCCACGLMLTTFWLSLFVYALAVGKMDLISVIPAWATVALVEWAAFREPQHGPGT